MPLPLNNFQHNGDQDKEPKKGAPRKCECGICERCVTRKRVEKYREKNRLRLLMGYIRGEGEENNE